jgi:spore coat protein U-like protein
MKKILLQIFPAIFLLVNLSVCGQSRSTSNVPISISVVKGINLTTIKGDLDFGEIVTNTVASKLVKEPSEGMLIEVNGNPGRNVFVHYTNTSLTVEDSESANSLNFKPNIVASEDQNYTSPQKLEPSSSVTLNNKDGYGSHYFYLGGEIEVDQNSQHGNYQGTLTLTVSY